MPCAVELASGRFVAFASNWSSLISCALHEIDWRWRSIRPPTKHEALSTLKNLLKMH